MPPSLTVLGCQNHAGLSCKDAGRQRGNPASWEPKPPFTVNTLYDLPDSDLRFEVLEGQLIVSAIPSPSHNLAADRLRRAFVPLLPIRCEAVTTVAVRMPDGDGPVPDLLVTTADPVVHERDLPAALVHTVVEVVSPSNATDDRVKKASLYAAGGIACYWRVELRGWREHFGPVPAIVVQVFGPDGVQQTLYAAGQEHDLPLAVGPGPEFITVRLDPAVLVGQRRP